MEQYEAPTYTAPTILSAMHRIVSLPRHFHSMNFADLISDDENSQKDYTHGLIVYASIMTAILFVWASVLVTLKVKGDSVGCASGKPFHTRNGRASEISTVAQGNSSGSSDFEDEDSTLQGSQHDDENTIPHPASNDLSLEYIPRNICRQKRTRIVFLITGVVNIVSIALLLAFAFSPVRHAYSSAEEVFEYSQDVVDQVKSAVSTISSAMDLVDVTVSSTSLNFSEFCPNYSPGDSLGVDLDNLVSVMTSEFNETERDFRENITNVNRTLITIEDALSILKSSVDTSEEYIWVLPALLVVVCALTTFAMAAVVLAWKEQSGPCFQRGLAYFFLPLFISISLVCWATAIGASLATMTGGDACTAGKPGTPDNTFQAVLQEFRVNQNSTVFKLVTAYTGGCREDDPIDDLRIVETRIEDSIDQIWSHISMADSIGRDNLATSCGGSLENLMEGARQLARALTFIRQALDSITQTLQCSSVSPHYIEAVHDALCTETAGGVAWAYSLLSIVACCTMIMITLRAAWYHEIEEEKVFDESEVAENMILNEHEEYLAYISKYKHEWQEYRGFNTGSMHNSKDSGDGSYESDDVSGSWTKRDDDGVVSDGGEDDDEEEDEEEWSTDDDRRDAQSIATDDISFPSLVCPSTQSTEKRDDPIAIARLLPALDDAHGHDESWEVDSFNVHKDGNSIDTHELSSAQDSSDGRMPVAFRSAYGEPTVTAITKSTASNHDRRRELEEALEEFEVSLTAMESRVKGAERSRTERYSLSHVPPDSFNDTRNENETDRESFRSDKRNMEERDTYASRSFASMTKPSLRQVDDSPLRRSRSIIPNER